MNPSSALLQVENLRIAYGPAEVVHGVSFALGAGRALALIGESGSGKSTIARAVLRLLGSRRARVDGSIRLEGREVSGLREKDFLPLRGRVLGFVPQDPGSSLNPVRTIGSQALEAAALVPGARRGAEREALVLTAFERVGLPEPRRLLDSFPHQLSGGQLQRVLIALAILPGPRLLVADEPTSALDVTVQEQILDLLDQLRAELGIGVLLITHDLALAASRADEVVVLQEGTVQEAGPTDSVFAAPRTEYTRALQADVPGLNPDRFASLRAARDARPPLGGAQVAADAISRTFRTRDREVRALSDVSFTIPRGRTHALVGESGSGKSTAARALLGLETLDAGTLTVGGREVDPGDPAALRALRRNLQLVHQNPFTSLDPRLGVERIVQEPLDRYRVGERAARAETTAWALEAVRLPASLRRRRPGALSGGQRQRVAIARALALRPEVLVLDEPTSALDVTVQAGILEVLQTLQRDLGLTYLFISHDLGVVRQFADTLTVLRRGEAVESGPVEEVFAAPREEYTRRLIASIPAREDVGARA
ncbi:dipeptide ABC transporter ATP-binding protein [Brachybacterium saurashtrense]|uniref:ABC transporter ATP-binding protein n=1 Tax=Brachybacterium saurashtrense TaxID=556288 RepID=A0A345YKB3_9MICO|nr:ABC transporter ATP-binding protein [Brachybacterium saurashtrense]AXK44365.1 ABC transporter ATP-binding protein [Brachybacterium saurashtrense]RRR21307.1 ABC transporter ATP-binding protein [Brachybacterium saurashtrense]RRR22976.1 ABC transporter ATP-binding protein [Brachybacterium saurashtrense]